MREGRSVTLATWMLEHLTPRPYQGLCGDLLEELSSGRSIGWYWLQVSSAIGTSFLSQSRRYAVPIAFSGGWSVLYPMWQQVMERDAFLQAGLGRWSAMDWPYSAMAAIGGAFLPAASFIWLGVFVYLVVYRRARARGTMLPSAVRILGSLSLSVNVLFVTTVAMMGWSGGGMQRAGQEIFHSATYPLGWSVPLFLSLSSALLLAFAAQRSRRSSASFPA